jgi:hypothetical protein
MDKDSADLERRKQRAFQRLGTNDPRCVACGEYDWRCLELHHIAGEAYGDETVILCRNCHRKHTDPAANAAQPEDIPFLERLARLLIGWGEHLVELGHQMIDSGKQLLQAAQECPRPWGWLPPQHGIA